MFAALTKTIITPSRSIWEGAAMKFRTFEIFPETKLQRVSIKVPQFNEKY